MNTKSEPLTTNQTMQLVHYGNGEFSRDKVKPIVDEHFTKPLGGLWTSPIDSKWGWKDWCSQENFGDLTHYFELEITGNVLTIDSKEDLDKLRWVNLTATASGAGGYWIPLFEILEYENVDAIHLTVEGERKTRYSKPYNLYGWDCESVLILNPDCITNVTDVVNVSRPKINISKLDFGIGNEDIKRLFVKNNV